MTRKQHCTPISSTAKLLCSRGVYIIGVLSNIKLDLSRMYDHSCSLTSLAHTMGFLRTSVILHSSLFWKYGAFPAALKISGYSTTSTRFGWTLFSFLARSFPDEQSKWLIEQIRQSYRISVIVDNNKYNISPIESKKVVVCMTLLVLKWHYKCMSTMYHYFLYYICLRGWLRYR